MRMKKKVLIGIVMVAVLIGAAFFYLSNRNRTLSPPGTATLTSGDLTVSVTYSRPSVRGRLIFGSESQNALQPYGKYWRLGANESTEITVNKDFFFNENPIKAGTYRMYAIPGAEEFEIVLNTELGRWGAFEPDYSLDVLRTKVPVQMNSAPVEQYTISIAEAADGVEIIFEWSDTRFVVPVKAQ
jgi:hypothetical protein